MTSRARRGGVKAPSGEQARWIAGLGRGPGSTRCGLSVVVSSRVMVARIELRHTLRAVGQVMGDAQDDWWIIASAAAVLHGVEEPKAGDVDVLASDRDVSAMLARLGVAPASPPPHPLFRSRILGQWLAPPLTVEFMAGFEYRTEAGWRLLSPETRVKVELEGVAVFIPARQDLAATLTEIGRPKDLIRARQLLLN